MSVIWVLWKGTMIVLSMLALMSGNTPATAQQIIKGERYKPAIWVDPDGCEHWVMDDGWEGYMTPHVNRKGIPVCRRGDTCGVMSADQMFATGAHAVNAAGRRSLQEFFTSSTASAFVIAGHTDSRASDDYNIALSLRRAQSVALIARQQGARVVDIRGYGERLPVASNRTSAGRSQNRRVEIICIR